MNRPPLLFIIGDTTAGAGIFASIFHILPSSIGTLAGAMAAIWYGILIFDRLTKRPKIDDKV